MGGQCTQCGQVGQRDDLHCQWDGERVCEISPCNSEWHAIKDLGMVYFCTFPFTVFEPE